MLGNKGDIVNNKGIVKIVWSCYFQYFFEAPFINVEVGVRVPLEPQLKN